MDADGIVYRLEESGATILSMRGPEMTAKLQTPVAEIVRIALESYGWSADRIRPPFPSAERIRRMDEALSWLRLIPAERYVLRRVVVARSLAHPITDRHLFPWRVWARPWGRITRRCSGGTIRGLRRLCRD